MKENENVLIVTFKNNIQLYSDNEIEQCYVNLYLLIYDTKKELFELLKQIYNEILECFKTELGIRDINISKLNDRANAIIELNKIKS